MNTGFTLIELIIVLLIVGIIVGISIPQYTKSIKNALRKEALMGLELIISAERVRKLELGSFCSCSNTQDCNDRLRLDLENANWNFSVFSLGGGSWRANAQYIGTRSDLNSCYRIFYENGNIGNATCN